jgi:hypothetical protein
MDNISTTTITDMTSQIGALELGDNLESRDDGVLEAEATGPVPTSPTHTSFYCTATPRYVRQWYDVPVSSGSVA